MRSLFLKIFISFWLIQTISTVVTFLQMASSRPLNVHNQFTHRIRSGVTTAARLAVLSRQVSGKDAYLHALNDYEKDSRVQIWIVDASGQELAGRVIPADTLNLAHRDDLKMPLHTDQGDYMVYAEVPLGLLPPFHNPRETTSLLVTIAVSGVVCYLLVGYLTRPIDSLRRAAQAIAHGDLSARAVGSRNQDQIGQLVNDFNIMAARLQSTLEAQQQMVSDISHELRSPLARLTVALELARARAGDLARSALDRIELESTRLNDMIGRILALAQITSGELHTTKQRIQLTEILRDVVADADFEARARSTSVQLCIQPPRESAYVAGYPSLLRSALENVIRNAIAYTNPGTLIEVNQNVENGHAYITIRDHGAGVPESELAKLFTPFYRVDNSRTRRTGGTGLGLAIAARAIALHAGTISAQNASDGGLIIDIRLPLESVRQVLEKKVAVADVLG
jgi:signal transduction histidine kinase